MDRGWRRKNSSPYVIHNLRDRGALPCLTTRCRYALRNQDLDAGNADTVPLLIQGSTKLAAGPTSARAAPPPAGAGPSSREGEEDRGTLDKQREGREPAPSPCTERG